MFKVFYKFNVKIIVFMALTVCSHIASACLCSDKLALEKGVSEIATKFPAKSAKVGDYKLIVDGSFYLVIPKEESKYGRGGGQPTVKLHRENCQVVDISLAR
ncbi:hypothetical protein P3339_10195 [Microbulbifer sp. MLAF003]|uniref:hypothetical protein n=1 Tax=Microbulbifer sp. MLAF003 TaxID=3032582 RepID=UPI0024AC827B|nr:hypothetical protein [Microbulbifer sp. MLAF003]WHI53098.1 hypothetical protein P3339_10195 [Microbulbifer sp. MLAF003]